MVPVLAHATGAEALSSIMPVSSVGSCGAAKVGGVCFLNEKDLIAPMELCPCIVSHQVLRESNAETRLKTVDAVSDSAHFKQSQVQFWGGRLPKCLSL